MSEPVWVLHHYEASPYAEKVRLLLGMAGADWHSALVPTMLPRPALADLAGGYRRIPVMQRGADIYCDSALIASEIASVYRRTDLSPAGVPSAQRELVNRIEASVFFSAIGSVKPLKLLWSLTKLLGPAGAFRFVKDRQSLMQGAKVKPASGSSAAEIYRVFLNDLEQNLAEQSWCAGDAPSYADTALYHAIWLHRLSGGNRHFKEHPKVSDWFDRVSCLGHGQRTEADDGFALQQAKHHEPADIPGDWLRDHLLGLEVDVLPADYGRLPVSGKVVGISGDRIVLRRESESLGITHVHFPRAGYEIQIRN